MDRGVTYRTRRENVRKGISRGMGAPSSADKNSRFSPRTEVEDVAGSIKLQNRCLSTEDARVAMKYPPRIFPHFSTFLFHPVPSFQQLVVYLKEKKRPETVRSTSNHLRPPTGGCAFISTILPTHLCGHPSKEWLLLLYASQVHPARPFFP